MYNHDPQTLATNLRMGFSAGARHLGNIAADAGSVPDDGNSNRSFFLLTLIVGFICTIFLLCILHLIEHCFSFYCCKRDGDVPETPETLLLHEGRIINLTGSQRRAVLEAIFSETSNAVVHSDGSRTKKYGPKLEEDKDDEDSDNHNDIRHVEIPEVSTVGPEDGHSSNADINTDVFNTVANLTNLSSPSPQCGRESWATTTSEYTYDDESTGDNVCPICLCEYEMGDMLVVSKYCTHSFHKDCILEWLEKHDDCPLCRVGMVTDSEMSQAAMSLVGKMRMCVAVASFATASTQRSPNTLASYRVNHVQPSPFHGAVHRCGAIQNHYPS